MELVNINMSENDKYKVDYSAVQERRASQMKFGLALGDLGVFVFV